MQIISNVVFSAFSYIQDREENCYDGLNNNFHIGKGIHIRWQFQKELGFPKNGFQIFDENDQLIKHVGLPDNEDEFLTSAKKGITDTEHLKLIHRRFTQKTAVSGVTHVNNIIRLITLLKQESELPQYLIKIPDTSEQNSLSILESLLMASIDPYMAKGLGLYTILPLYGSVPIDSNSKHLNFKIVGDWGNTPFPYYSDSFANLFLKNESKKSIQLVYSRFVSGHRVLAVQKIEESSDKFIIIKGNPHLQWHLQLTKPVKKVELFIYTETKEETDLLKVFPWQISDTVDRVWPDMLSPTNNLEYRIDSIQNSNNIRASFVLTISSKSYSTIFNSIFFFQSPESLKFISRVNYYEKPNEEIGEISFPTTKEHLERQEIQSYYLSNQPVPKVPISTLVSKTAQPFFNEEGKILKKASDIFLRTRYVFHPEKDTTPIRFLLNRTLVPKATTKPKLELLTRDENHFNQPHIINQEPPNPHLPYLISYFPFDGIISDTKNGNIPKLSGSIEYRNLNIGVGAKFKNNGYIEVKDSVLSKIGDRFTISFKTRIQQNSPSSVILSGEKSENLFLGIDDDNHVVFRLNGHEFKTKQSLTKNNFINLSQGQEIWCLVKYNQTKITIHVKPILDSNSSVDFGKPGFITDYTNLLEQKIHEESNLGLGRLKDIGDYLAVAKAIDNYKGYKGVLKDLSIWRNCFDFIEIAKRESFVSELERYQNQASLIFSNTNRLEVEKPYEELPNSPLIGFVGKECSVQFWFKVAAKKQNEQYRLIQFEGPKGLLITIKYEIRKLWLKLFLVLDGNEISFDPLEFKISSWNRLTLLMDGENSHIWANEVKLTRFNSNQILDFNRVLVGENIGDQFTHFTIWNEALTPEQIDDKLGKLQYIDRQLLDGTYKYNVIGVDLLGRVSKNSATKSINCKAKAPTIDMPTSTFARIIPFQIEIENIEEMDEKRTVSFASETYSVTKKVYKILFDLPTDMNNSLVKEFHFLIVNRKIGDKNISQRFLIEGVTFNGSAVTLTCLKPPFCQMTPEVGDKAIIDIDFQIAVDWKWTGLQQVYNPEVTKFKLYSYTGNRNLIHTEIKGPVSSKTDALPRKYTFQIDSNSLINEQNLDLFKERYCRIGSNNYQIEAIELQNGAPLISVLAHDWKMPEVQEEQIFTTSLNDEFEEYRSFAHTEDWNRDYIEIPQTNSKIISSVTTKIEYKINRATLKSRGITWLPDKKMVRIVLDGIPPSQVTDQKQPSISHYVPSAIVAKVDSKVASPWESFTVLWHEWENGTIICYTLLKEINEETPLELSQTRLYIGQHLHYKYRFENPLEFYGFSTLNCAFGLTAASEEKESKVGTLANVVLVDKRVPPEPPRPIAKSTGIADYYKKIKVTIDWGHYEQGDMYYNVFNTSYATVIATDVESRRLFRGHYRDLKNNERSIFKNDDSHFEHWFETVKARDWQDPLDAEKTFRVVTLKDLFTEKKDSLKPHKTSIQWRRMSVVWQNWAERFYYALNDLSKMKIAEREGNEEAFTLLNTKPITEKLYDDEVQGYDPDCFFYRVRTLSKALVGTAEWSLVSNPIYPKLSRKPRKPELSKVIPGDCSVTLYWNLNREPRLSHYLIYKAETKEELEDLRWWRSGEDPRIIGRVYDPRIKVINKAITIKTIDPIKEIIGIYNSTEFDYTEENLGSYNKAFNYYDPSSEFENTIIEDVTHATITKLKPVVDYTVIVLVYKTEHDELVIQDTIKAHPKLTIKNSALQLPPFLEIKEVIGIYKEIEFNAQAIPIENQQAANNFFYINEYEEKAVWEKEKLPHSIYNLYKLEEGVTVVFLYRTNEGNIKVLRHSMAPTSFMDSTENTESLFYRLTSACKHETNLKYSEGSKIYRAK